MALHRILVTMEVEGDLQELHKTFASAAGPTVAKDIGKGVAALKDELDGIANGSTRVKGSKLSVDVGGPGSEAYASKEITVTFANLVAGDFLVIGNRTYIATDTTPGANEFEIDTDSNTTAANLEACIDADDSAVVTAAVTTNKVAVTSKVPGTVGDGIVLQTNNPTGLAYTGRNLSGGVDGAVSYVLLA